MSDISSVREGALWMRMIFVKCPPDAMERRFDWTACDRGRNWRDVSMAWEVTSCHAALCGGASGYGKCACC